MQITRKQIIDHLSRNHFTTASELSSTLNVTAANIRHHLGELKKQEIIETFGKLPGKGRGRPQQLYRLSKNTLEHNLANLSEALLKFVLDNSSADDHQTQMNKIARIMGLEFGSYPNLFQRLNQLARWLNKRHYQARWEASPTGPRVFLGHCPYSEIIDSNPEICMLDQALISNLIGIQVTQVEKLERNLNGARYCVFISN
jgi:predicted ArsR family transcriptional regulator